MKSYLITDPLFYGHSELTLADRLKSVLDHHTPDFALLRDKETPFYHELAGAYIAICRQNNVPKVLLHGDVLMAHQFGIGVAAGLDRGFALAIEHRQRNVAQRLAGFQ